MYANRLQLRVVAFSRSVIVIIIIQPQLIININHRHSKLNFFIITNEMKYKKSAYQNSDFLLNKTIVLFSKKFMGYKNKRELQTIFFEPWTHNFSLVPEIADGCGVFTKQKSLFSFASILSSMPVPQYNSQSSLFVIAIKFILSIFYPKCIKYDWSVFFSRPCEIVAPNHGKEAFRHIHSLRNPAKQNPSEGMPKAGILL